MKATTTLHEERRIQAEREHWDEVYSAADASPHRFDAHNLYDEESFFNHLISEARGRRILSVGGGIDALAVYLAGAGAEVVSVDVSKVACQKTEMLAQQSRVGGRLQVLNVSCEQLTFNNEFDLVISKGALHHINYRLGVTRIGEALVAGGSLIATEPACLSSLLRGLQRRFPYHPHIQVTADEIKLTSEELRFLRAMFSTVECFYFEFLSRPSLSYLLTRLRAPGMIPKLKMADARLTRYFPFVRNFCQHVVIRAQK